MIDPAKLTMDPRWRAEYWKLTSWHSPSYFKTVLYDLDGTLVESEWLAGLEAARVMMRYQREVLGQKLHDGEVICFETGEKIPLEQFPLRSAGVTMFEMLERAANCLRISVDHNTLCYWDRVEMVMTCRALRRELKPVPGAHELVAWTKQRFDRIHVATSSVGYRAWLSLLVTDLLPEFENNGYVVSGQGFGFEPVDDQSDDAKPWQPLENFLALERPDPKPKPTVFLYAMEKAGTERSRTVVLEDSPTGVAAAVAAEAGLIIALANVPEQRRVERREQLRKAGAHYVVDRLDEIPPIIENESRVRKEFGSQKNLPVLQRA